MREKERGADIKFEIVEKIGVIKTYPTGWSKEINLVEWNDGPAKYDIRDWDHDHQRMSRGVTLHEDEMQRMLDVLSQRTV